MISLRSNGHLALAVLLVFLLPACAPSVVPKPRPTPQVITVEATPALYSLNNLFHSCTTQIPNTGLALLETPVQQIDLSQANLVLRWGAIGQMPSYSFVIGQEELVVVVNPDNPRQQISLEELQAIYQGQLTDWPNSGPEGAIQAWTYPTGSDTGSIFEANILNGTAPAKQAVSLAPDPKAMRQAVSENVWAIGFLPRRWVNSSVKAISLEGLDPSRLQQPILALSKSEPKGPEKTWLICLQQRMSE